MSGESEDFKLGEFHGKVLGELDSLRSGQKITHQRIDDIHASLDQFKCGIGETIQEHDRKIIEVETHQGVMAKILWIVGAAAITALVTAIMKGVIK